MSRRSLPQARADARSRASPPAAAYSNRTNQQITRPVNDQGAGQYAPQNQYQQQIPYNQYLDPEPYAIRPGAYYYPVAPPPAPAWDPYTNIAPGRLPRPQAMETMNSSLDALVKLPSAPEYMQPASQSIYSDLAPQGSSNPSAYQNPTRQTINSPRTQTQAQRQIPGPGRNISSPEGRRHFNIPIWQAYHQPTETLDFPAYMTLFQIANQYPNHLYDHYLDDFIRCRWTAAEIQACMPAHCQNDLKARGTIDSVMWIQKRLQKRDKALQSATDNGWKKFWESPQRRVDGRPADIKLKSSSQAPRPSWLDKKGLQDLSPPGMDGTNWREPPGVSYFRLKQDWSPPVEEVKKKRLLGRPRPYSTGTTGQGTADTARADRRRTAPPNVQKHEKSDDDMELESDMFDDSSQPSSSSRHRTGSRRQDGTPSDVDENNNPQQKHKAGMCRPPLDYAALDAEGAAGLRDEFRSQNSGGDIGTIVVASHAQYRGRSQVSTPKIDGAEDVEGERRQLRSRPSNKRKR